MGSWIDGEVRFVIDFGILGGRREGEVENIQGYDFVV